MKRGRARTAECRQTMANAAGHDCRGVSCLSSFTRSDRPFTIIHDFGRRTPHYCLIQQEMAAVARMMMMMILGYNNY